MSLGIMHDQRKNAPRGWLSIRSGLYLIFMQIPIDVE
jgi:hypothetical protein